MISMISALIALVLSGEPAVLYGRSVVILSAAILVLACKV